MNNEYRKGQWGRGENGTIFASWELPELKYLRIICECYPNANILTL